MASKKPSGLGRGLGALLGDDVLKTELQLQKAIPKKDWVAAHHWLIFHGRRVCHARNPQCASCGIQPWCKAAKAAGVHIPTLCYMKGLNEIGHVVASIVNYISEGVPAATIIANMLPVIQSEIDLMYGKK